MSDKEILIQVLHKSFNTKLLVNENETMAITWQGRGLGIVENVIHLKDYYKIIFSHDFAKVFWGEKTVYCKTHLIPCKIINKKHWVDSKIKEKCFVCKTCGTFVFGDFGYYTWKEFLQIMVLESNPLKYLENFLEKEN